jgi:cytochrome c oxidase cbb3-type subunit 1
VGVFAMFLDLTFAGIFQGYYWSSLQPWDASVDGSQVFWQVRVVAGLAMFAGLLCFLYNIWMTARGATSTDSTTAVSMAPVGT